MKKYLVVICIMLAGFSARAQQTASQVLSVAERDYEQGKLMGIPDRLEPFFRKENEGGFNKAERIRAQKLITLVHIFTDNEPQAEQSLVKLLKLDPEHKRDPRVDPAEFYFLYDKFRTKPIFRLSLKVGVNKSLPNVVQTYGVLDTEDFAKFYNGAQPQTGPDDSNFDGQGTLGIGFWGELSVEKHIWKGIEAGLGLQMRSSRYDVDQKLNNSPLVTFISNQQTYFRTPLYVRYNYRYFSETGPIPYVTLGGSFDYLIDAFYAEATRQGGNPFSPTETIRLTNVDLPQANPYNFSVFGALGVKLRLNTHFLTFEARYDKSLLNYINPENRWNGSDIVTWDLSYVEDDLGLDMVSFSIGYTHSIYSPKKLKEFR